MVNAVAHETREISETVIIMRGLRMDFVKLSGDVVCVSPEFAVRLISEDKGTEKRQSVLGDHRGVGKRRVS